MAGAVRTRLLHMLVVQGTHACPGSKLSMHRLTGASRYAGNTLGCLGLLFAITESMGSQWLDIYAPGVPSYCGTLFAGAFAGAVFRSPRGPKAAAITAAVGTAAAAGLLGARQVIPGA